MGFPFLFTSRRKKVEYVVRAAPPLSSAVFCLALVLRCIVASGQSPPETVRPPAATDGGSPLPSRWPDFDGTDRPAASVGPAAYRSAELRESVSEALRRFEPAETVAQVGDQFILKGELLGDANLLLMNEFARLQGFPPEEQQQGRTALLAQREQVMEQLLQLAIDRKLMYLEYLRSIPPAPDEKKAEEQRKEVGKRVSAYFSKQLTETAAKVRVARPEQYQELIRQNYQLFRISLVMKAAGIESPDDPRLERLLRENGTSLQTQRQAFMERLLGQSAVGRNLVVNQEITHDQMLNYYHDHPEEFHVAKRVRWEQLSAYFKRFSTKAATGQAIVDMGNQVLFGGAPLYAVAKKYSQEKNADKGGFHDWTAYGDLGISRVLHDAVFSLPLDRLSEIIEDEDGLHIVRVLEREEAHFTPFTEAQVEIKEKLNQELRNKAYKDYVAGLRERTPVWTVYDDLPSYRTARPPANGNR